MPEASPAPAGISWGFSGVVIVRYIGPRRVLPQISHGGVKVSRGEQAGTTALTGGDGMPGSDFSNCRFRQRVQMGAPLSSAIVIAGEQTPPSLPYRYGFRHDI